MVPPIDTKVPSAALDEAKKMMIGLALFASFVNVAVPAFEVSENMILPAKSVELDEALFVKVPFPAVDDSKKLVNPPYPPFVPVALIKLPDPALDVPIKRISPPNLATVLLAPTAVN